MNPKLFLSAKWENLIIASYETEPELLEPHLPKGLAPDTLDGIAFVSLVAFNFNETKVKGITVPFHINFPEINLRFYVKNKQSRGVVFIREFVPRYFIAKTANLLFNENYVSIPMKQSLEVTERGIICSHRIMLRHKHYHINLEADNRPYIPPADSTEHFFKEHEWGFGRTRTGESLVYKVEHPFWEVFPVLKFEHNFDFGEIYGEKWKYLNKTGPFNIAFAKGSPVRVYSAQKV